MSIANPSIADRWNFHFPEWNIVGRAMNPGNFCGQDHISHLLRFKLPV
jgi:hypothetical protein